MVESCRTLGKGSAGVSAGENERDLKLRADGGGLWQLAFFGCYRTWGLRFVCCMCTSFTHEANTDGCHLSVDDAELVGSVHELICSLQELKASVKALQLSATSIAPPLRTLVVICTHSAASHSNDRGRLCI